VVQGEVACLRNAMLSKLLDAEEKLRAATAEHEASSRWDMQWVMRSSSSQAEDEPASIQLFALQW
jgi:hypothetical protein